jgi:small-conductance mechanosensitive channel
METLSAHLNNLINLEKGIYFLENSLWNWILAVIIAIAIYFILRPIFNVIVEKIDKVINHTDSTINLVLIETLKNSKFWFFAVIAIFFGSKILNLGEYEFVPFKILILTTFVQVGIWLSVIFSRGLKNWNRRHRNPSQRAAIVIVHGVGKFFIWSAILLLILDNFGVRVISLLAGLGVGGIALALAVQKVLGDLFASISIMIDKPFEIGDLINVGTIWGTVETIGVKTTRIRALTGEQVIIANSDLLDSRVSNFKRMSERRITLGISVSNQTSKENLHAIVDVIKGIIDSQNDARYDRGHLKGFSASSVDYEFIYWVTKPDYLSYMDVQQQINLAIIDAFAEREINLAYSTQRVLVENNGFGS